MAAEQLTAHALAVPWPPGAHLAVGLEEICSLVMITMNEEVTQHDGDSNSGVTSSGAGFDKGDVQAPVHLHHWDVPHRHLPR